MSGTCLVITGEPPWPPTWGGRLRVARVVEQLAARLPVVVAYPAREVGDPAARPPGIDVVELPWSDPGPLAGRLVRRARMGEYLLRPSVPALMDAVREIRPGTIYWTHSYLPATAWDGIPARHVVEFANVEHLRARSIARSTPSPVTRALQSWEYAKGRRWEDRVARRADIVVALGEADAAYLRPRARRLVVAPNGLPDARYVRSPAEPVVGTIGMWEYPPNRVGLQRFLATTWPEVKRRLPAARLLVAGPGSTALTAQVGMPEGGVEGLGFVENLADFYAASSVVLAPAGSGGGQQLKVAEALAHGRVVVGPEHVRDSVPAGMPSGAVVAAERLAEPMVRLLTDDDGRWRLERAIADAAAATGWADALRPIVDALAD